MLSGDVGDAFHEFLVLALRVVEHGDRRLRNLAELRGLADVIHADFEHCDQMHGAQTQHHQRQADVIVQIARGRQHPIDAVRGAQDRRRHFLDRRLAIAPDNGDDRQRKAPAPERGEAR